MLQHQRNLHGEMKCGICDLVYFGESALAKHEKIHEEPKLHRCTSCSKMFARKSNLTKHMKICYVTPPAKRGVKRKNETESDVPVKRPRTDGINRVRSAFKGAASTYRINVTNLKDSIFAMKDKIEEYQKERNALKFTMAIHVEFVKSSDPSIITDPPVVLNTQPFEVYAETDISSSLIDVYKQLENAISVFQKNGSGWTLSQINSLDLSMWELDPLRGSSYHELPEWIIDKRAVVNVKAYGNDCFKWAFLAGMHEPTSATNRNKMYSYTAYEHLYDFSSLSYPVPLKDINTFAKRNNVSINVYGCTQNDTQNDKSKNSIHPLKVCDTVENRHVNLLLTEKDGSQHYSTIKSFSRLVRSQVTKYKCQHFFCYACLHGFTTEQHLKDHKRLCQPTEAQREVFPYDDPILKFTNIQKQLKSPFVAYADFETILKPEGDADTRTGITEDSSKTTTYQKHAPCSFAFKIVSIDPEFQSDLILYEGEDAALKFIDNLQEKADEIFEKYISNPKPMVITPEQELEFQNAISCHICGKDFIRAREHCHNEFENEENCTVCVENSKADVIAQDHCHITSFYRSASHAECNLKYRINPKNWKLQVMIHNLKGFDSHLIIQALEKRHGKTRVIAQNMEKYMSFAVGRLQFLDSMQFMPSSLDKLTKTLNPDEFIHTHQEYTDPIKFQLLQQKGVYPYDHMDSFDRFQETSLPIKESFFNKLNDTGITEKQYQHAQNVWNAFGCTNMRDYHDVYLKSDVLLLTDVFEKFRATCMQHYGLDPVHYYTSPGMAWDAALKVTDVKLELITDIDQYKFIESAIRGGVSMISTRYAKANNPYVEDYDPSKPTTYIIYLDANNLYGWAMIQCLPTGGFRFFSPDQIESITKAEILAIPDDGDKGYAFEIDVEYGRELHEKHSDYPLMPESLEISSEMYSPFMTNHFPDEPPQKKLTPNLRNKSHYIVHYSNLKLCLQLGLKITKIHRVLEFNQSPWLKPYIDLNTRQRAAATTPFEKDFFKLMNCSVFGKTQENLRNRVNVELVTDEKIQKKRVSNPKFKCGIEINENLTIIQSKISTLMLNRPIYVGFSVLDLSKVLMYDWHYNYMQQKYPDSKLCFTDTDSLTYLIQTDDIYKDMLEDHEYFDFSDYPKNHPMFEGLDSETIKHLKLKNKKIVGKMKDEFKGTVPGEFVGLLPKLYSFDVKRQAYFDTIDGEEVEVPEETPTSTKRIVEENKHTAKGIKRSVKDAHLRHHHYLTTLTSLTPIKVSQNLIRSKHHQLQSVNVKKTALTAFDTKRWICDDGIHTLAYGHYKTL